MSPLQPDTCYHIYNHANGFENVFKEAENYRFFMEKYQLFISPIAETYAYCLMPNHFHLLVCIRKKKAIEALMLDKKSNLNLNSTFPKFQTLEKIKFKFEPTDNEIEKFLSKQFSNLFSSYTQSFNKVYDRMGSLFVKNFKREPIFDKTHFLNTVVYIHRNPIHHGFCSSFEEWPYCSYNRIVYDVESIVEREKMLKMTGGIDPFIEIHIAGLSRLESLAQFDIP